MSDIGTVVKGTDISDEDRIATHLDCPEIEDALQKLFHFLRKKHVPEYEDLSPEEQSQSNHTIRKSLRMGYGASPSYFERLVDRFTPDFVPTDIRERRVDEVARLYTQLFIDSAVEALRVPLIEKFSGLAADSNTLRTVSSVYEEENKKYAPIVEEVPSTQAEVETKPFLARIFPRLYRQKPAEVRVDS